jgi:hypothetical protein
MSQLFVDNIKNRTGGAIGAPSGAVVTGVVTATTFKGNVIGDVSGNAQGLTGTPDITVRNIIGVGATFSGVLTYEDVTNIDSLGIITARSGIEFGASGVGGTITAAGQAEFIGIVTALGVNVSGVVTATSFKGDGSALTGVESWNQFDTWLYSGG